MLGKLPQMETKEGPYLNSTYIPQDLHGEKRSLDLDTLVYWIKRTPECIGVIKRIATDIVTTIDFVSVADKKKGRPSDKPDQKVEDKAKLFFKRNNGRDIMMRAVMDWLMTGDSYIWKGTLSDEQVTGVLNKFGVDAKGTASLFYDEDWNGINEINVVPSSMVTIDHNNEKVIEYIQQSRINPNIKRKFKPEEIIHAKYMDIDGRVYGFSPMESSFMSIKTINAIQDYSYNYFANGAKVDRLVKFMGNVNEVYTDKIEEVFKKYQNVSNAHGTIVLTGADKIETEALNEIKEEMEYRHLALWNIGRLAFAFNMPADTFSAILGTEIKGTAMGSDMEDTGYNRNIVQSQVYWENLMDSQLWIENFKVQMFFERTFRQDQIRQIQYMAMVTPVLEFMFKHEYPISDEYVNHMLQIPRQYLKDGKIKREIEEMGQPGGNQQLSNDKLLKGKKSQNTAEKKKGEQSVQQSTNPPIGS